MEIDVLLQKVKRLHFIGIGGSGMCPLAEIMHHEGYILTGSDANESDTLQRIRGLGIPVFTEHKGENVNGAQLVVYTAAVKSDNPELVEAKKRGIPCAERSVFLGAVTRRYRRSVAISGTHGKTSTTAMLAQILIGSGFDPSAIIGGKLPYIGSNSYVGQSDIMVCEACEYVDTFLQLSPAISVVLNIDEDHLDYFKNLDNIKHSFNKFAKLTTDLLVYNGDDENSVCALADINIKKLTFGLGENNDYCAKNVKIDEHARPSYDLFYKGELLGNIKLSVLGMHNVYNSLAAATVAHFLGASINSIANQLEKFTGVHRRFEILGNIGGVTVADDFAHHPTELTATLSTAKQSGFKRVIAVFQPHTYSRTAILLDSFAKALSIADKCIISEILAVREQNTYNIYSKDLGCKIENAVCIDTFEEISEFVKNYAESGDLVITLGGGNVYMCADLILKKLRAKEYQNQAENES